MDNANERKMRIKIALYSSQREIHTVATRAAPGFNYSTKPYTIPTVQIRKKTIVCVQGRGGGI